MHLPASPAGQGECYQTVVPGAGCSLAVTRAGQSDLHDVFQIQMNTSLPTDLEARLAQCSSVDRRRLQRRIKRLHEPGSQARRDDLWRRFHEELRRCEGLMAARRAVLPAVSIPESLPIAAHVQPIIDALHAHPVVIVCGDTGSGKSTQLPKICLLAGRGMEGQVAQTQPRRIAARSIAQRLAEELGQPLGQSVGYKVRFDSRVRRESSIKVMTDGLLLAELGGDPRLRNYDTVIIDEAHERSLNIDFLLGYLHRLLPRRRELKVIISSATLDSQRFSEFFNQAPVIHVEGRNYPVEICYQESLDSALELPIRVEQALSSLMPHTPGAAAPGDTLVFLSGEREIHEVAGHLGRAFNKRLEIVPLYSRLSIAQQGRIFTQHSLPRVVLATNIAETSLTVPGIRFVVDAGRERIGRYNPGCAVQRLPVENISKASAAQRAGRCGREAPGICVRLYSEDEYQAFPDFQEAEIRRTDLAAVLLRMRALGVMALGQFPFIEPPVRRHVNDGLRLLRELDALDDADELTATGRRLARLPVDPRVGRMLLKAGELNCVSAVLVIAAGLSVAEVREHRPGQTGPLPQQLRFEDERSDFLRLLKIWEYLHAQAPGMKAGKLRNICKRCRLSYPRVQEWREVHLQLSLLAREIGLRTRAVAADYAQVHRALLAGLLRNVGQRAGKGEYAGLRGNRFRIARSSGQAGRNPGWILAAELVDTGQTLAFMSAAIKPKWIERAAGRLLHRGHFEGYWDTKSGEPMVYEQTRLYSLTITARRRIRFSGVSHAGAREVFIRGALVDGAFDSEAVFVNANRAFIKQWREREARLRSPDPRISDERLFEFYDQRIPATVFDTHTFEFWWPGAPALELADLLLEHDQALSVEDTDRLTEEFPKAFVAGDTRLALDYCFEPGHEEDGVSVSVPFRLLQHMDPRPFEWHVAGLREEKTVALLRILPKLMRRRLGPAQEVAREFLQQASPGIQSLYESLSDFLALRYGVEGAMHYLIHDRVLARLPAYLNVNFRVVDDEGVVNSSGRDMVRLQARTGVQSHRALRPADSDKGLQRVYHHDNFPFLADQLIVQQAGGEVRMYPALLDQGDGVRMEAVLDIAQAQARHEVGIRQLVIERCELDIQRLARDLPQRQRLCLLYALVPAAPEAAGGALSPCKAPCSALCEAVVNNAVSQAYCEDGGWSIRDQRSFDTAVAAGRGRFSEALQHISELCDEILDRHRELQGRLGRTWPDAWQASIEDVREQAQWLVWQGFFQATARQRLRQLPRYLMAACRRLEKLERGGARDGEKLDLIRPLWDRYRVRLQGHHQRGRQDPVLEEYRWLLEEFRVSIFAQELGTRERSSRQRLDALWQKIAP